MWDYFNLTHPIRRSIFARAFGCTRVSSSLLQKPWRSMMIGFRVLAYGCSTDVIDDYVRIMEDTTLEAV
jgi:hypothetical protein